MKTLKKQCQKDLYELSKLTLIPAHSNRILRQLDLSRYESMKPAKIVDMVLNIAGTSNQQEIENFKITHFSDYKYYCNILSEEIENIFSINPEVMNYDIYKMQNYLIEQGYRINLKLSTKKLKRKVIHSVNKLQDNKKLNDIIEVLI